MLLSASRTDSSRGELVIVWFWICAGNVEHEYEHEGG